jgi:hypothetical protein
MNTTRFNSTLSFGRRQKMNLFQQETNWLQVFIGLLVLIIGSLVYLVDRPPGQTYFVYESRFDISLYNTLPNLFGTIGNILPDFSHVFAFILITAGILSAGKTGCMTMTIFWFLMDILFEFGQKFAPVAADLIPVWFEPIPFLKNTSGYFKNGTFDWLDMAAILAGSVCAYFVLIKTMKGKPVS